MAKYRLELAKKSGGWGGFTKYPGCFTTFGPYRTRTGRYYTGLSEGDIKRISKATGIEEIALQPPSDVENIPKLGSFWKSWVIKVSSRGLDINTDDPYDEIKYLFLKGHHWVAQGSKNQTPGHKFLLINVDEEAIVKNTVNKKRREAFRVLDKMTIDDMRRALRVLGTKSYGMSNEVIESTLHDLVEKNVDKFLTIWVNNDDREILEFIDNALDNNVIRKEMSTYFYGTDTIGHSLDGTIAWAKEKENKQTVDAIKAEIKAKSKI